MTKKLSELEIAQKNVQANLDVVNTEIAVMGQMTKGLYTALTHLQQQFDKIRNVPSEKRLQYEELKQVRLKWKQQADKIGAEYTAAAKIELGAGGAAAGIGVGVVAMGPTVAMGVATTFGVASTGTAISALSGAAATNAALAWLGGGALAAGGGGMAAGEAFLALAGPVGWAIAGTALAVSGLLLWKTTADRKKLERIFTLVGERDAKKYELAAVELKERIDRIDDETPKIWDALSEIKTFGEDYAAMTEDQQYALGACLNLMLATTNLLVNPILGLKPAFGNEDFRDLAQDNEPLRKMLVYLCNLLYNIKCDESELKLLAKSFKGNKEFLETMNFPKDQIDTGLFQMVAHILSK